MKPLFIIAGILWTFFMGVQFGKNYAEQMYTDKVIKAYLLGYEECSNEK